MIRIRAALFATALAFAAAPAFASANVDCSIDDKFIKFEMEAIAGRNGPIVQVNVGAISIKPAAGISLSVPEISFDQKQITQQWLYGGDLKLNIEVYDEKARESVLLIIQARLDKKTEKFSGGYVLKIERGDDAKALKGRIKECVAG